MKGTLSWLSPTEQPARGKPKERPAEEKQVAKGKRFSDAQKKEIVGHARSETVPAASLKFQVSQNSIYTWIRSGKYEPDAVESRHDASATPEVAPGPITSEQRDEGIIELWRQNPGYGPSQIRNMLKRVGVKVSVATVRNVMEEHGYVRPKMKPREHTGRYEASRPRELYHLDFYHFHVHKQKQCLLFIQDDFSRFISGWALTEYESAVPVIAAFERAVATYGKPERVMSDRGSAFHSWKGLSQFGRMLEDYEINFHLAKEPAVNGKVEALNAAFQKECLTQYEFMDLTDASRAIHRWVEHYNHQRTHHSLGGILVPADRFYGLADRTLKMVELGQGAHALDILNPESRGLELFRVTSHGGQPQVFLMGKKILG